MVEPWQRPSFRPTGRDADFMLIAFADEDVLGAGPELRLGGRVPSNAPAAALDLRVHHYADVPDWVDGWRADALRNLAAMEFEDLSRLDAASCCYSITVSVPDPADLSHLQLGWAVAAEIAAAGAFAFLDVHPAGWQSGESVAALPPERPFVIQREVRLIAENEATPGFGHPVHTRGMVKFGRPELVVGVPAERIQETGQILNHLARMMAEGELITPGQKFRVNEQRVLVVEPYTPDGRVPELHLNNDALLLVDG